MTNQKEFIIKVNGVQFGVPNETLTAREVLQLAKEKDAIAGEPDTYILRGEKQEYGLDEIVNLAQDNIFIAILNTPTPVA